MAVALAIPVVSTLGYNAEQVTNRVVEDVNNFSFTPKGENTIQRQLSRTPDDPVLLFTLGQVYQLRGLWSEAEGVYRTVINRVDRESSLRDAALMNIARFSLIFS